MTSPYQILDEHIHVHTIADMFCSKWISHHISHRYDIALRNPFSQSKSMTVYTYIIILIYCWLLVSEEFSPAIPSHANMLILHGQTEFFVLFNFALWRKRNLYNFGTNIRLTTWPLTWWPELLPGENYSLTSI